MIFHIQILPEKNLKKTTNICWGENCIIIE